METEKTTACGVENPHVIILPEDKKYRQRLPDPISTSMCRLLKDALQFVLIGSFPPTHFLDVLSVTSKSSGWFSDGPFPRISISKFSDPYFPGVLQGI